jgi:class 3 adenylate cyclase
MTLPQGTVTFLFTDIEGSMLLLHELGDAYAKALEEHRRVLREASARHEGVEVDTQVDAFFAAFAKASDALAAAREAREARRRPDPRADCRNPLCGVVAAVSGDVRQRLRDGDVKSFVDETLRALD